MRHVFAAHEPAGHHGGRLQAAEPGRGSRTTFCGAFICARRGKGEVVIFNRSHYEDVLVVRVHKLVPQSVWSKRYDLINDFEKLLVRERHDAS